MAQQDQLRQLRRQITLLRMDIDDLYPYRKYEEVSDEIHEKRRQIDLVNAEIDLIAWEAA